MDGTGQSALKEDIRKPTVALIRRVNFRRKRNLHSVFRNRASQKTRINRIFQTRKDLRSDQVNPRIRKGYFRVVDEKRKHAFLDPNIKPINAADDIDPFPFRNLPFKGNVDATNDSVSVPVLGRLDRANVRVRQLGVNGNACKRLERPS